VDAVARETDFLDLYRSLGLKPGCGLAEFKQAYRRRVAVLHPDRRPAGAHQAIAAERLQRLTALYGEAMDFQRRHGRLPGAAAPARATPAGPVTGHGPGTATPADTHPSSRSRPLVLLAILVAVLLLWFGLPQTPQETTDAPPPPAASQRATSAPFVGDDDMEFSQALERGMRASAVRRIEGEPMMDNGEFWEYGPSWIRFERGRVVDWYSSPLRPLKLADTRRPADTQD
jgi:hypothetical protein